MANYSQRYNATTQTTATGSFYFDTFGGVDYSVAKAAFGAAGSITLVSAADPLPVTISGVSTAALQTTGNGILTTIDADTGAIATAAASIDGKTPALGQALAAASVPVVLTAAQISTLTPPAAISGFALESSLSALNGKVTACNTGAVVVSSMPTVAVTGTFWQATQPVSLAGSATSANQETEIAALELISDALTSGSVTIDAPVGTPAFVRLSDGSAAITTLPVSLAIALPAGTNSIGQVTANAGTNLNTAALALESGGNLAAIATSAALIDDAIYDETLTSGWGVKGIQCLAYSEDLGGPSALLMDNNSRLVVAATIGSTVTVRGDVAHDGGILGSQPIITAGYASAAAPTDVSANGDATYIWCLRNGSPVVNLAVGGTLVTASAGLPVAGGVSHDGVDSGNPHKIGGKATTSLATATLVAGADRVDTAHDLDGAVIVRHGAPLGDNKSTAQSVTATTSTAATNFGAVSSTKNVITEITVYNSSATPTFVKIQDGSGGATFWTCPAPAGGGSVVQFTRGLKQPTANTALYFAANDAATTVYISINGYQSKV